MATVRASGGSVVSRVFVTGGSGFIGRALMRETIAASAGVTYWASSREAIDELGFPPRNMETGLRDTLLGESA